jgi:hypothetical protein
MREIFLVYVNEYPRFGFTTEEGNKLEQNAHNACEYDSIDDAQNHMELLIYTQYFILKKM